MSKKDKYIFMVNEEYSFAEDECPFLFVGDVIELVCEGNAIYCTNKSYDLLSRNC